MQVYEEREREMAPAMRTHYLISTKELKLVELFMMLHDFVKETHHYHSGKGAHS